MAVEQDALDMKARELPEGLGWRMVAMICDMLDMAYDKPAGRYKNPADTDRTIADAIGEGCLWGWVAMIRAQDYGPEGDGAEIAAIRAEIDTARAEFRREIDAMMSDSSKAMEKALQDLDRLAAASVKTVNARLEGLAARIDAVVSARGGVRGKGKA